MIHYLIDTSWFLYRGHFACASIWNEYPELHYLIKKLESILSSRTDCDIYLCIDGYSVKGRRLLGESYKADRNINKNNSYNVYIGLSTFIKLLNNKRIHVYYNSNYESDEIIYTLSKTLDGRKKILSGDKDLLQSLDKDTVIESFKGLITTEDSYKYEYADTFFEIEPNKLPIFRAIAGDVSDSLKPPVARFPRKLAAKIVKSLEYDGSCPTIDQLRSVSKDFIANEKKWVDKLIESYKLFSINFDIMKLNIIDDDLITNINDEYYSKYQLVEFSDFLKSKIERLNTL